MEGEERVGEKWELQRQCPPPTLPPSLPAEGGGAPCLLLAAACPRVFIAGLVGSWAAQVIGRRVTEHPAKCQVEAGGHFEKASEKAAREVASGHLQGRECSSCLAEVSGANR